MIWADTKVSRPDAGGSDADDRAAQTFVEGAYGGCSTAPTTDVRT